MSNQRHRRTKHKNTQSQYLDQQPSTHTKNHKAQVQLSKPSITTTLYASRTTKHQRLSTIFYNHTQTRCATNTATRCSRSRYIPNNNSQAICRTSLGQNGIAGTATHIRTIWFRHMQRMWWGATERLDCINRDNGEEMGGGVRGRRQEGW